MNTETQDLYHKDFKNIGVTIHKVDKRLDTGDIILQREYPISSDDSYATLLERSHSACAEILSDAINQICSGKYNRIEQNTIHDVGFYCGIRGEGDELIDWSLTSREIFNFIRAICNPGPRARTFIDGSLVLINSSRLIEGAPTYKNTPGQLISKTKDGFLVKTGDSFIEILEYESEKKLRVGYKFKNQ